MKTFPFIPTRGILSFPEHNTTIDVGRYLSLWGLDLAIAEYQSHFVLISQKEHAKDEITDIKDLHEYGTLVEITRSKLLSNGNKRVTIKGIKRVKMIDLPFYDKHKKGNEILATVEDAPIIDEKLKSTDIYFEKMQDVLNSLYKKNGVIPDTIVDQIQNFEANEFINLLCMALPFTFDNAYKIFSSKTLDDKMKLTLESVIEYRNILNLDVEIDKDIKKNLDLQQQEFLLREKLKAIQKKLGDSDAKEEATEVYIQSYLGKEQYPKKVREIINKEKMKLKSLMSSSPEANTTRNYIELLTDLPWRKVSREHLEIKKAKKILENHHYGLKEIKERIVEFLAVMANNKSKNPSKKDMIINTENKDFLIDKNIFVEGNKNDSGSYTHNLNTANPILTLIGPPGTGKTTLAKSIAETLDRKFIKISLGGVRDEAEIRGHRRTYVSSLPGKIIIALKKAGVSNPVVLLDEIDKMSSDNRGDPASALLEVLDPEQNTNFQDHYLEIEYDLSKVLFIATANYYDYIPAPLLDRVEIIELSSYTILEKISIAKNHLIPKTLEKHSLEKEKFKFEKGVIEFIIKHYTLESGVRSLQRVFDKIARKIVLKDLVKPLINFSSTKKDIREFLGPEKFDNDDQDVKPQIGAVNGLAYTQYGGSTLSIEVATFPGKGEIKLTGQLKDVMQESAQIAYGYVRSHADEFDIDFDFEAHQLHIHVPEGAVPKDGPSAGVTFTTAIISALSKKEVSHKIGMTGEITLRGKVLAIGGLKEKSLAAQKHGIEKIFIPKQNEKNLVDIPEEVKDAIEYVPVTNYRQIYKAIFK